MVEVLGMPPSSLLDAGRNTKRYFKKDFGQFSRLVHLVLEQIRLVSCLCRLDPARFRSRLEGGDEA